MDTVRIEICMGSSCHSRGNSELSRLLDDYRRDEPRLDVVGALCQDRCSDGPNVTVDGQLLRNPDPVTLRLMIVRALEARQPAFRAEAPRAESPRTEHA